MLSGRLLKTDRIVRSTNKRYHIFERAMLFAISVPATKMGRLERVSNCCGAAVSTTEILEQVLDPFVDCLTPDAARKIVALRADLAAQTRLDELADRANEGLLTSEERAEYEKFRAVFHMISLLQSKARQLLGAQRPS